MLEVFFTISIAWFVAGTPLIDCFSTDDCLTNIFLTPMIFRCLNASNFPEHLLSRVSWTFLLLQIIGQCHPIPVKMIKKNRAITFQHEFNKQQNFKNISESKSRQHLRSCMISMSMLKTCRPSVWKQLKFISSLVLKMELSLLNRKGQMLFRYLRKMINNRLRFNDPWFLFHDSSWSIQESYLRWKHISRNM